MQRVERSSEVAVSVVVERETGSFIRRQPGYVILLSSVQIETCGTSPCLLPTFRVYVIQVNLRAFVHMEVASQYQSACATIAVRMNRCNGKQAILEELGLQTLPRLVFAIYSSVPTNAIILLALTLRFHIIAIRLMLWLELEVFVCRSQEHFTMSWSKNILYT